MTPTDNLLAIFFEAAHHASIIPLASEATIYAMKAFGGYAMQPAVIAAIAGALVGHGFNGWLGQSLIKLPAAPTQRPSYLRLQSMFNRYGFLLLIFAWAPLCNILVVAAGMFGTPLKKALPVLLAGLVWYYGRLLAT